MAQDYTVEQGDSLTSIAFAFGFRWETLWNHPKNAQLKGLRKDPHVIYAGDVLHIPDKEPRIEIRAADAKHQFVRNATPDRLRVRLLKRFEPRANIPYTLVIDGKTIDGATDGDGMVNEWISPGAKEGKILLDGGKEEYPLALGSIDPIDAVSGLQSRLANLGYFAGEVSGEMDDETKQALTAFQAACRLPQTGNPDAATLNKLKSEYGC